MEITNNLDSNISNRKLSIQVALNGLSFCSYDGISREIIDFDEISISTKASSYDWEELLVAFLSKNPKWKSHVEQVTVFHQNSFFTWVPSKVFMAEHAGSYLQFSAKVYDTDLFAYDSIPEIQSTFVYVPLMHLNNLLLDYYPSFEYFHSSYYWVKNVLNSKIDEEVYASILVGNHFMELLVLREGNLILHNHFEIKSETDILYYVLFSFEQLHLNPDHVSLYVMGSIEKDDATWTLLYDYVRNVYIHPLQSMHKQQNLPFHLSLPI